jgi:hypothetical protein
MKFDENFQELMKFDGEAPDCIEMTHPLMKRLWSYRFEIA